METRRTDIVGVRATVPCINANKKFWSEFFELYKNLPALWDLKHPDYSHRDLKVDGYNKLIIKLKELYPNADRELVVGKINTYRTSFRKELRKLREYEKKGIAITPTLWYFDNLSFLIDQVQLNPLNSGKRKIAKKAEEKQIPLPINQKLPTQQDFLTINKNIPEKPRPTQYLNFEKEYLPEPLPINQKLPTQQDFLTINKNIPEKPRPTQYLNFEKEYSPEPLPTPPPPPPKKKPNAYPTKEKHQPNQQATADILAKSWAVQYEEMQGEQKLIARKLISDILFHGCLGNLEMSHAMRIQDILLSEAVTNYHHSYYRDSQETMDQREPRIEYLQEEEEDINEICSMNSED